jgi:pyruvate formate lyase activating enzyme
LVCWWCHNPETRPRITDSTKAYEIADLVKELERDARYWLRSGGGITVSGGEPLYQPEGLAELLIALGKCQYYRAVDTSGTESREVIKVIAGHTDLWLWDLKAVDGDRYRRATGGEVRVTLSNLSWILSETSTPVVVRIPLIEGFNCDAGELRLMADWLNGQDRPIEVELLAGHCYGFRKGKSNMYKDVRQPTVSAEQLSEAGEILSACGIKVADKPGGSIV